MPFQLALTATYAAFFAEPRYRVPIEMMAFPFAAFALRRWWSSARAALRAARAGARCRRAARAGRRARRAGAVRGGARDQRRGRAAARRAPLGGDGLARRRPGATGEVAAPRRRARPVAGVGRAERRAAGAGKHADPIEAEVVVASLPPGRYRLEGDVEGFDLGSGARPLRAGERGERDNAGPIASVDVPGGAPSTDPTARARAFSCKEDLTHAGGPLVLRARLAGRAAGDGSRPPTPGGVWISPVRHHGRGCFALSRARFHRRGARALRIVAAVRGHGGRGQERRAAHPGPQTALIRFLIGVVVTLSLFAAGRAVIRPRRWGWLIARGFFGGIAVLCYFACIERVPVGVATLLNQTQPVYTMLFAWLLIDERPSRAALVGAAADAGGGGADHRRARARPARRGRQRALRRDPRRRVGDHLGHRRDLGARGAPRPG